LVKKLKSGNNLLIKVNPQSTQNQNYGCVNLLMVFVLVVVPAKLLVPQGRSGERSGDRCLGRTKLQTLASGGKLNARIANPRGKEI
jgi:hypothetical protein